MNIEQLKLILETVGQAADGAKNFAMWWLVVEFVNSLFRYALGGALIFAAYRLIRQALGWLPVAEFHQKLRDINEPSMKGTYVTDEERNNIIKTLKAAKENKPA